VTFNPESIKEDLVLDLTEASEEWNAPFLSITPFDPKSYLARNQTRVKIWTVAGLSLVTMVAAAASATFIVTDSLARAVAAVGGFVVAALIAVLGSAYVHLHTSDPSRSKRYDPSSDRESANESLIRQYHAITRKHATRSYVSSQIAMAIGLTLLVAGAIYSVQQEGALSKATTAALTALAGTLSAYVSNTFVKAHNRALDQLNYFFGQPLVNNYLINAERIAEKYVSDAKRDEVMLLIIRQALDGAKSGAEVLHSALGPTKARNSRKVDAPNRSSNPKSGET